MKRLVFVAVLVIAATGSARADWGGVGGPPIGPPSPPMGVTPGKPKASADRYGLLPALRKPFKSGCGRSWVSGGYVEPDGVSQGTLAFPNHPFVRSPRDFFMYEPGR